MIYASYSYKEKRLEDNQELYSSIFKYTSEGNVSSVVVPIGVNYIPNGTFNNKNIRKIVLPDTLDFICNNAFKNNKITEIDIPGFVKEFYFSCYL